MSTCWYSCCGRVIAACLLAIYCANETCGIGKQFPKQRGLDSWKREEPLQTGGSVTRSVTVSQNTLFGPLANWGNWRKGFASVQNAYQNIKPKKAPMHAYGLGFSRPSPRQASRKATPETGRSRRCSQTSCHVHTQG